MEFDKKVIVDVDGFIEKGKQFDLDLKLPEDDRNVVYGVVKDHHGEPIKDAVVKLVEVCKDERKAVSHSFTDKEGEFVFGPLCPNKSYSIQIWVNRVKHVKICKICEHEGKCLKGVDLYCEKEPKKDYDHYEYCRKDYKDCEKNDDYRKDYKEYEEKDDYKKDYKKYEEKDDYKKDYKEYEEKYDYKKDYKEYEEKYDYKKDYKECEKNDDCKKEYKECDKKDDYKKDYKECEKNDDCKKEYKECDKKDDYKKDYKECDKKDDYKKDDKECEKKDDCRKNEYKEKYENYRY